MNKAMIQILMMFILILQFNLSAKCAPLAPALYVFGDSLVDSGNNNLLLTAARADYSPYGINFKKGSTGRFTNGRTTADFIAEYLGLPNPPPYLSLSLNLNLLRDLLQPEKVVTTGLNYASGSCGILPETGSQYGKCLNMDDQVDLFEKTVNNEIARYYKTSEEVSNYLSKSVFVIAVGSNDYKTMGSPQSFANLLIINLSQQLQRLYNLGARKVIIFEMGTIGCMPSNIKKFKPNGRCVEELNQFALLFNAKLATMLHNLKSTLGASSFILVRCNELTYDAIINPSKYGLVDTSNPCCVAWFNGTSGCIPELQALACKNPNNHYFFDAYHPTETVYKTIATLCFNGSSICTPNIQQLVSST